MRIYNEDADTAVDWITLFLTESEARSLVSYLQNLIEFPESAHSHITSPDLVQQITVTVVREHQLGEFDERSQELWRTGK